MAAPTARFLGATGPALAVAGALLALRLHGAQPGLLYPDGYQYLLMAEGLASHGRPFLVSGHGGDALLPSGDAAAKPLFPALVALLHLFGASATGAARLLTAAASAGTVVLAGVLALRLTASRAAAVLASAACLVSPELRFWSAFSGPDPLGQLFGLAAALSFLAARPAVGGALVGLAALSRPELLLPALAAALVGLALPATRPAASRALVSCTFTLSATLLLLRPPLVLPPSAALAAAAAAAAAGIAFLFLMRRGAPGTITLAALLAVAVAAGLNGHPGPGAETWLATEWPLVVAALAGLVVAAHAPHLRLAANALALTAALLAIVYSWKNSDSDRYLALLTPLIAVLASFGVAAFARRMAPAAAALAALALMPVALGGHPPLGPDPFPTIARELEAARLPAGPVITAAPDAYGVLLPGRAVQALRAGAAGLVLLDAAQRAYAPTARVRGHVVARLDPGPGFRRADGRIDHRPVTVVAGAVQAP